MESVLVVDLMISCVHSTLDPDQKGAKRAPPVAPALPAALQQPSEDLPPLGEALKARAGNVLAQTVARTRELGRAWMMWFGRASSRSARLHGRRRALDGGRGGGGRSRGRAGVLADLRPARLPARGAAERGHQTLPALARLRGGGAALQRQRAGASTRMCWTRRCECCSAASTSPSCGCAESFEDERQRSTRN